MAGGVRLAAGGGTAGPGRPRGSLPGPERRRRRPRGARAAPGSLGEDEGERAGRPATKLSAGRRRGWWALATLQLHLLRALAQGRRGPGSGADRGRELGGRGPGSGADGARELGGRGEARPSAARWT